MLQIFRHFEYPAEIVRTRHYQSLLHEKRQYLLELIVHNDTNTAIIVTNELIEYDKILEDAFIAGISVYPSGEIEKWTTLKAVFFSSTVLTTIGKIF